MAAQSVNSVAMERKRDREEQKKVLFLWPQATGIFCKMYSGPGPTTFTFGLKFDQTTHVPPSGERTPPHCRACVQRPASAVPSCAAGGTSKEFKAERGCCSGGECRRREQQARRARRREQSPQCVLAVLMDVLRVSRMCALRSAASS